MNPYRPKNITEPNLDYLKALAAEGRKPVDVALSVISEDCAQIDVIFADDSSKVDYFDYPASLWEHFREAIEYVGYGPQGFGNLVHAEICDMARTNGVKNEAFVVALSRGMFEHLGRSLKQWTYYGYRFVIDESLHGISYVIGSSDNPKYRTPEGEAG